MDILTKAMCKPKIINLNDYGIYLMQIMQSGKTVTETTAGVAFLTAAYKAFNGGRLPIAHDESAGMYLVPSGITNTQFTGSLVGALPSGNTIQFIKADIIVMADRIAMFTTMLS